MEPARLPDDEVETYLARAPEGVRPLARDLRRLLLDAETKEEPTGPASRQLGYALGCNLFATLEPQSAGLAMDLWVGPEARPAAERAGWGPHPHPLRAKFGWVRRTIGAQEGLPALRQWVEAARAHAALQPQR